MDTSVMATPPSLSGVPSTRTSGCLPRTTPLNDESFVHIVKDGGGLNCFWRLFLSGSNACALLTHVVLLCYVDGGRGTYNKNTRVAALQFHPATLGCQTPTLWGWGGDAVTMNFKKSVGPACLCASVCRRRSASSTEGQNLDRIILFGNRATLSKSLTEHAWAVWSLD